jgi:hypothetical protein
MPNFLQRMLSKGAKPPSVFFPRIPSDAREENTLGGFAFMAYRAVPCYGICSRSSPND